MLRVMTARAGVYALLATVSVLAGSPAHAYDFQTLNNSGDAAFNQLLGINNSGLISGYFGSGNAGSPNQGYLLTPPSSYTNENFPGSLQTQVTGLNNTGTSVGFYSNTNNGPPLDSNIGFYDIGGSFTSIINPSTPSTGITTNQLLGVNDHNVAVGFYTDGSGISHGYTYTIGSSTPFSGDINEASGISTVTTAINNSGEIAGFYTIGTENFGFLDNGGVFTTVDVPGSQQTQLFGLNDHGFAVGDYVDSAGNMHGLLFNSVLDVFTTIDAPGGFGTTTLNGINDLNQIVGFYVTGSVTNGLLITGVPEPSTWAMMALGFATLGFAGYRKARRGGAALA
jgi:hypothetical protein